MIHVMPKSKVITNFEIEWLNLIYDLTKLSLYKSILKKVVTLSKESAGGFNILEVTIQQNPLFSNFIYYFNLLKKLEYLLFSAIPYH